MTDKTHYRKAFDSPYLSSADIVDPVVLTIRCVRLEKDATKKTSDQFNTAHFAEQFLRPGEKLKPMILNATNSSFLAKLTGSKWIDDWNNVPVIVYVDPNVRFGKETVEGLRLGKPAERPTVPDALMDAANMAAESGTATYSTFWSKTGPANRKLLAAHHEALKKKAAEADQAAADQAAADTKKGAVAGGLQG